MPRPPLARRCAAALVLAALPALCLAQGSEPAPAPVPQSAAAQGSPRAGQNAVNEKTQPPPAPAPAPQGPPPEDDGRLAFMPAEAAADGGAPGVGGLAVRALGALMLIVGLIVAAGFGVKKLGGARLGAAGDSGGLALLSSVALGDRRSLSVVSFDGRTLLVGSTPHSFTLLASGAAAAGAGAVAPAPPVEPARRSVAEMLRGDEEDVFGAELAAALNGTPRPVAQADIGGTS